MEEQKQAAVLCQAFVCLLHTGPVVCGPLSVSTITWNIVNLSHWREEKKRSVLFLTQLLACEGVALPLVFVREVCARLCVTRMGTETAEWKQ